MGSPFSPIAADIVMDDLETKCIASLPFHPPPFYYKYVDDIIKAVPSNEINTVTNNFKGYKHKIQFTVEEKSVNRICFLDVLVIRDEK